MRCLVLILFTALFHGLIATRAFSIQPGSHSGNFTIRPEYLISNPISKNEPEEWKPATSVFLELMGKGFYSVNIDLRRRETSSFSIGMQILDAIMPSVMYYRFYGSRSRLETGAGVSGIVTTDDGLAGMAVHGVIGYRYQKKKGLIFRIGFTPFFGIPFLNEGIYKFVPLGGISLGYCF